MEKSDTALKEKYTKRNVAASASKSLGSFVQINSIAVDLSIPVEEIAIPPHGHFSIRGYVAEMRKRDRKLCLPFASEAGNGVLEENLAPLYVPKFRWWQCLNCTAENTPLEIVLAHSGNDPRSACAEGREKVRSSSHIENIAKTEVSERTTLGNKHLGEFGDAEKHNSVNYISNSSPCAIEEIATGCKNGADFRDKACDNTRFYVTQSTPLQIQGKNTNASDSIEPSNWMNDDGNMCPPIETQSGIENSDIARVTGLPSLKFSEPDNLSSGSDDNSSGLPHRRRPKLRYLADILEAEKNSVTGSPRTRCSSNGMHVVPAESEAVLAPQYVEDVPEDVEKKKVPPGEDRTSDMSESISEGDDSTKSDMQLGKKTQWIKTRKRKIFDSSKKKRYTHVDDGKIPAREVPKVSTVDLMGLQKHAVTGDTSFCKLTDSPPTLGQMRKHSKSFQSGQHKERISGLSKNKRPEVEADQTSFLSQSNVFPREGNVRGKLALDLSLNNFPDVEKTSVEHTSLNPKRSIPENQLQRKVLPLDLNETFTPKMGEELPTLENGSLPSHNPVDVSASYIKDKTRKGQGLEVNGPQNDQQSGKRSEHEQSDDIPMEIVELLAKNQHERALGNSRKLVLQEQSNRTTRGSSSLLGEGYPIVSNFLLANTRGCSVNPESDSIRADQSNLDRFVWLSRNQPDMTGKLEEASLFNSVLQNQQRKSSFSAPGSNITGSRLGEGAAESLWYYSKDNVPFHLAFPKNCSSQLNNQRTRPFTYPQHKGKTISDIKHHEEKFAVHDGSLLNQGSIGSCPKSMGSLDPYSNDTIPAMQLLSLMNQGMISSSFNVGTESFRYKDLSPCTHHPRLNGDENLNTLSRSFFLQHHHPKELPGLPSGVYGSSESFKKPSPYRQISSRERSGVGPSNSMILPQLSHKDVPSTSINLENSDNLGTSQPRKIRMEEHVCTLNQNPADFSIPDARNQYTISAKDLGFRKRNASKERSSSFNVEGHKRQRVTKKAPRKEAARK